MLSQDEVDKLNNARPLISVNIRTNVSKHTTAVHLWDLCLPKSVKAILVDNGLIPFLENGEEMLTASHVPNWVKRKVAEVGGFVQPNVYRSNTLVDMIEHAFKASGIPHICERGLQADVDPTPEGYVMVVGVRTPRGLRLHKATGQVPECDFVFLKEDLKAFVSKQGELDYLQGVFGWNHKDHSILCYEQDGFNVMNQHGKDLIITDMEQFIQDELRTRGHVTFVKGTKC